jgi:hypothetical protein
VRVDLRRRVLVRERLAIDGRDVMKCEGLKKKKWH